MKNKLSIDHEVFKKIKDSLNYALLLAIQEADDEVISKISMTIDVSAYDDGDEKKLNPIEYSCNVKSSKDVNKDKDSTDSIILRKNGNTYYPFVMQVSFDDFEEEENENY